jgi:hypothetical protein
MTGSITSRHLVGAVVALLFAAALAAASRVPLVAHATDDALLRLAWTARPERIERCRTLGAEELAALPAHMRQAVECESVTARYRVEVFRDGTLLAADDLRGGGLRNDRQLYHHRELRVPSGPSAIEVRVTRTHPEVAATTAPQSSDSARARRRADEMPPALVLAEAVTLEPREVMLIVYDRTARRLRAVRME